MFVPKQNVARAVPLAISHPDPQKGLGPVGEPWKISRRGTVSATCPHLYVVHGWMPQLAVLSSSWLWRLKGATSSLHILAHSKCYIMFSSLAFLLHPITKSRIWKDYHRFTTSMSGYELFFVEAFVRFRRRCDGWGLLICHVGRASLLVEAWI